MPPAACSPRATARPNAPAVELTVREDAGGGVEVRYWVVENMLDWEEPRHGLEVASDLVARLVDAGNLAAALELYTRCRRVAGGLGLEKRVAAPLAAYAESVGRTGIASELAAVASPRTGSPEL